jgi:hypothetical protein
MCQTTFTLLTAGRLWRTARSMQHILFFRKFRYIVLRQIKNRIALACWAASVWNSTAFSNRRKSHAPWLTCKHASLISAHCSALLSSNLLHNLQSLINMLCRVQLIRGHMPHNSVFVDNILLSLDMSYPLLGESLTKSCRSNCETYLILRVS